ncbi:sugar ABC transporter substrate-binding protein [Nocardioides sp. BYT-33-1]|jgi:ribose transport system substrate-binding protein|uniref:sugar ABC transporter substrate-binding protein n=1 Tax=Nocardioides sp. BYT-33-1 TaxID=3416952 RepID=UPI003F52B044
MNRRITRTAATVAATTLLVLTLAACGATEEGGGEGGAGLSDATRARLEETVTAATRAPEFAHPGPPIDVAALRGKVFYVIPLASNSEFNKVKSEATVEAGEAAGVEVKVYTTTGVPSQFQQGMEQAIAEGAAAILLDGPDPALLRPQIEQARKAGIPVVVNHALDTTLEEQTVAEIPGIAIGVPGPFSAAQRLLADYVALESGGGAETLFLGLDDLGERAKVMEEGYRDELEDVCPDCEVTVASTTFADAAASTTNAVQTALRKNPDLDYVVAPLDFVVPYVETALKAVANTTTRIVTFNGTSAVLTSLSESGPQVANLGEPITLMGYTSLDQAMRLALGQPAVEEPAFTRLFTADNIDEAGDPPAVDGGYGDLDAFVDGYRELWGVS